MELEKHSRPGNIRGAGKLTFQAGTLLQNLGINGSFSEWQAVTCGVPQGSVLGSQQFIIYINDLDERIECHISKFADDTKLGGNVCCEEDAKRLQGDLDRLAEWANSDVVHFGPKNRKADCYLNVGSLGKGEVQRDLGVMVEQSLKVSMLVQQAVRKVNGMPAFIARRFEYWSNDVLLQLYRAL
eukprot:g25930.t1